MFCNKCGAKIDDGQRFCTECGTEVVPHLVAAMEPSNTMPANAMPVPWMTRRVKILIGVGVGILLAGILASILLAALNQARQKGQQGLDENSNAELIKQAVQQVVSSTSFPSRIDSVTTWDNITAEPDAIHYYYTLSGMNTDDMSNAYLKSYLNPKVCSDSDLKSILGRGINLEYTYTVKETFQMYDALISKADCL